MKKQIKDYEKGMNNYKFSIDVDAWIDGIEIEAHNIDEAKEKLSSMELEELIGEGYVKGFDITDIDYDEEVVTIDDDEINEQIGGRPLEFENGEVFYVECVEGTLYAGHMTNAGIMHEYEIEYDVDKSLDENLQVLADEIMSDLDI